MAYCISPTSDTFMNRPERLISSCVCSAFGADRAPVTEAATTFAPAASAPVTRSACISRRSNPLSALEKNSDSESNSTTETNKPHLPSMRCTTTPHERLLGSESVASSDSISTPNASNSNPNKRRTMALQRTAPGRLRVSRWLLPADPPRSQRATLRRPSAVSELESFGVFMRLFSNGSPPNL